MADPYATSAPDLSDRPTGPPPWEASVTGRGGALLGPGAEVGEAAFLVIHTRGIGTLAPFVRLEPALGVLLWLEHVATSRDAEAPNELLIALRRTDAPLFGVKQGCVGGPGDRPGCFTVDSALVEAVLEAGRTGGVTWERDPDFGYDVPGQVPGLDREPRRALLPRLLYADHDRVYEHASLVAAKKRERYELARSVPGLAQDVVDAAGWPPVAGRGDWRP